jgi:hypothetical protein
MATTTELEARIKELEARLREMDEERMGGRGRALVDELFPPESRKHMREAWKHNLLAVRSVLDPHDLELRRRALRVRDDDALAVTERRALERNPQPLCERDGGQLDDPAVRDRENAILLTDPHRDTRPCRELLGRECARVFALAQDLSPVRQGAHLAEDAIADHATHLRKETGLDSIRASRDELSRLLRTWKWARENEREGADLLRQDLRHFRSRPRERALLVSAVCALRVTADFKDRHTASLSARNGT